jgi:N-acetylmuramoyl-L-alanine amidase
MRSVLTRDGDFFIPLHQRVSQGAPRAGRPVRLGARRCLHQAHGARFQRLRAVGDGRLQFGGALAGKKENAADLIGGVNLESRTRTWRARCSTCRRLPRSTTASSSARTCSPSSGASIPCTRPHVEQAGFAVLKAPDIPSILVETAFISNPEEEKRLNDEAYQDKMAEAILAASSAISPRIRRWPSPSWRGWIDIIRAYNPRCSHPIPCRFFAVFPSGRRRPRC